jgi:hypothetical protein
METKLQSEFYSVVNGMAYYEQYFTTQTQNRLSINDWKRIHEFIEDLTGLMSEGIKVEMNYKIVK